VGVVTQCSRCTGSAIENDREYFPFDYPCQTWLPHPHVTVSVGCCLVNCFLQMGHALVITYVMALTPRLNHSMAGAGYKFIVSSCM
jgi:hypothetical protein